MSKAIICDRCAKIERDSNWITIKEHRIVYSLKTTEVVEWGRKEIDLCFDCWLELERILKKWFGGKHNGIMGE